MNINTINHEHFLQSRFYKTTKIGHQRYSLEHGLYKGQISHAHGNFQSLTHTFTGHPLNHQPSDTTMCLQPV
jgi:hypothetical protein